MILGMQTNHGVALLLGALACICDIRTRRIPNLLTFGGALLALLFAVAGDGPGGLRTSMEGWAVGLVLFLPMFLLGGMGAGDVKLLACLGAWCGPQQAFWMAIYAMVAGGVMAAGVAVATGYMRQAISNIWVLLKYWRVMGVRPLPELTLTNGRVPRLPYAIPIAAGAVAAIWMR
jgi:prepilin peptidase CpaA